jgi:GntR family transcriptional repressor for pyruvate dehydrogenase complex
MTEVSLSEPILRQKNYELLAEMLQAKIIAGEIKPGEELDSVRVLMRKHGVGQSTVREALRILQSRGLIIETKGGFAVATITDPFGESLRLLVSLNEVGPAQLHDFRETVEVAAAGYAAERRTPEHLAEIRAAERAVTEHRTVEKRRIDADLQFHFCLARASQNVLYEYMELAVRQSLRQALRKLASRIPPTADRATVAHAEILAAIEASDANAAREAMRRHMADIREGIRAAGIG